MSIATAQRRSFSRTRVFQPAGPWSAAGPPPEWSKPRTARIRPGRPTIREEVPTMENGMRSVGIDLHAAHIAVLDQNGRGLLSQRITDDPETVLALLEEIDGEPRCAEGDLRLRVARRPAGDAGHEQHRAPPLAIKAIAAAPSRPIRSTRACWRTCCVPICCRKRTWPPGSCAGWCATAGCWCGSAPRSNAASTR
jgi:hypothetical protein